MAMFQGFTPAGKADTPDFIDAERLKAEAAAQALRERNTNITGAAMLYDRATGDNSPLYDSVFGGSGASGGGAALNTAGVPQMIAAPTAQTAASIIPSGGEALLAETLAGAAPETAMALGEGVLAPTAGAVADIAATGGAEALAGEALASGALAEGAGAGLMGAAGSAIPPILMAALLSRALGLWS